MFTRLRKKINKKLSPKNTSGHTGVYFHKISNKWRAVAIGKKRKTLGNFEKIEDAIEARKKHEFFYIKENK